MGIGIVLVFWGVAWMTAAIIGSVVLSVSTWILMRKRRFRKRAIISSATFPFACIVFVAVWFVSYAAINTVVFHKDIGLGDGCYTPLPNGYSINFIDATDQGTLYRTGTDINSWTAINGVRQLQLDGRWIYGARDKGYFDRLGSESDFVDTYFQVDTSSGTVSEFPTITALQTSAKSHGSTLALNTIYKVYSDHRFGFFDYAAAAVLFITPLIGFILLMRWIWHLRKADPSESNFDPGYLWNRVRSEN